MDRFPVKNLAAKIFALLLAAILWMYVMNEQNPYTETTLQVPLEIRNLTSPLLALDAPDSVKVRIRGPRSIVAGVLAQDIKSFVDLRGLREGRHTVKIQTQVPTSLELVENNPDKAIIRLDMPTSRSLPVEIRLTGTAPPEIIVSKTAISPEQVALEGPRSVLESVDKIVAVVDLTGKSADFTVTAPVQVLGREGKPVEDATPSPGKVNVAVTVTRGANKKIVDIKTLVYGQTAPGFAVKSVITEPPRIEISGTKDLLDKIDYMYTEPINLAGVGQDTTKEVRLQPKEGVTPALDTVKVQIMLENKR